ncbi:MAG: hypothetical protein R3316_03020 [Rhodovibrionaceae bacterium]|nr:hypothetical protein [Rhodovibrionaceae bacterium]
MSEDLVGGLIMTAIGALGGLLLSFLLGGFFRSSQSPLGMMILIIAGGIFGLLAQVFLIDEVWLQRLI